MDTATKISLEELKAFREDFLGFHGLDLNRVSWFLTSQLFIAQKTKSFSVFSVTDQMQHLEERWIQSHFKDPKPFRHPPLSGLFKVHFVDARFLATNLRLEMQTLNDTDIERLFEEAKGDEETDVITERWIGNLTHKLTYEAYMKRASKRRLTGEWLILGRFQDHWYYLGVAQHSKNTTQDTAIYTQLKAGCSTQFPFLFAQ